MGAGQSVGAIVPKPIFTICSRSGAEQQLRLNEQLDQYNATCLASAPNRAAAPTVEPTDPPADAVVAIGIAALEPWLQHGVRGTNIAFFLEGLPHTREIATIWLPYDATVRADNLKKLLMHESIHIHQRIFRDIWSEIYESVFRMQPFNGRLPTELESKRRLNPDTILWPLYLWNNYVPVMVFLRPDAPRLTETRLVWYNVADGSWSLATPNGWVEFFGTVLSSHCEHPNELAAYILSEELISPTTRELAATLRATLRFKIQGLK